MKLVTVAGPQLAGTAACAYRGCSSRIRPPVVNRFPSCFHSLHTPPGLSSLRTRFQRQEIQLNGNNTAVDPAELKMTQEATASAPELLPTLQTRWGMVIAGGKPLDRGLDAPASAAKLPSEALEGRKTHRELLNLQACFNETSIDELKKYIVSYKRLDTEQAAALAISQLPEQQALQALKTIPTVVQTSCMWREANDLEAPPDSAAAAVENGLMRLRDLLQAQGLQTFESLQDLTAALMSIRRQRPKHNNKHRLSLPDRLLDSIASFSELQPTSSFRKIWQQHYKQPQSDLLPGAFRGTIIVVSKKVFSRLQTHLNKLAGDQSPAGKLHRSIDELENVVEKGAGRYDALQGTSDNIAVAFSFMAIQRQRQLKVVSDHAWTTFLKKGEGAQVQQKQSLTADQLRNSNLADGCLTTSC
ncbi:hypothetical protein WJX74_002046 [Apatococcus lobatus]|uniref:Uncharacterized protein n=1 Tax=Apatococcus lobatus TaxID=904363 RepID=A0AAW1QUQ2_9CHLO